MPFATFCLGSSCWTTPITPTGYLYTYATCVFCRVVSLNYVYAQFLKGNLYWEEDNLSLLCFYHRPGPWKQRRLCERWPRRCGPDREPVRYTMLNGVWTRESTCDWRVWGIHWQEKTEADSRHHEYISRLNVMQFLSTDDNKTKLFSFQVTSVTSLKVRSKSSGHILHAEVRLLSLEKCQLLHRAHTRKLTHGSCCTSRMPSRMGIPKCWCALLTLTWLSWLWQQRIALQLTSRGYGCL